MTENARGPSSRLPVALDVTVEAHANAAAQAAIERFGRIDVLLNNAGFGLLGAVEEATAAEVEAIFATNVFGTLTVTRAVLPHMRAARSGRVLNISSIGGYRGGAGFGVYCAAKFAVEGLSEALHHELAPLGIQVTVIEPGYFRTDFLDGIVHNDTARIQTRCTPPDVARPDACRRPKIAVIGDSRAPPPHPRTE